MSAVKAMEWTGDSLNLLDQRKLPFEVSQVKCGTAEEVANAICNMVVRGAPIIGSASAFGIVLSAKQALKQGKDIWEAVERSGRLLKSTRPTAFNLPWAVNRLINTARNCADLPLEEIVKRLEAEALAIFNEDYQACQKIGQHGANLLPKGCKVLTICNTGSLATCGDGTALSVIRHAYRDGKVEFVWVCETRPFLQGSRLTAWELSQDEIPFKVIVDSAGASLMSKGLIDAVIVGADRIARNGDVSNKIGTYMLAILAKYHQIPFNVAAPTSTIDLNLPDGNFIPIEERSEDEVLSWHGVRVAPERTKAFNPAFDVTPSELVTALITDIGILKPPYEQSIAEALKLATSIIR